MTGVQATTIGHLDSDGLTGDAGVDVGTLGFQVVSRGASIGDSIVIERGWGTA